MGIPKTVKVRVDDDEAENQGRIYRSHMIFGPRSIADGLLSSAIPEPEEIAADVEEV